MSEVSVRRQYEGAVFDAGSVDPVAVAMENAQESMNAGGRALGNVLAAIADFVEPFLVQRKLELLDPKVRDAFSAKEKGEIDAYFHGVHGG